MLNIRQSNGLIAHLSTRVLLWTAIVQHPAKVNLAIQRKTVFPIAAEERL